MIISSLTHQKYVIFFIKLWSTIASSMGPDDQIDMVDQNYLAKTLAKHSNHVSVLAKENHHKNHNIFSSNYVHKIKSKLNENRVQVLIM